jgi:hypothetical protein
MADETENLPTYPFSVPSIVSRHAPLADIANLGRLSEAIRCSKQAGDAFDPAAAAEADETTDMLVILRLQGTSETMHAHLLSSNEVKQDGTLRLP